MKLKLVLVLPTRDEVQQLQVSMDVQILVLCKYCRMGPGEYHKRIDLCEELVVSVGVNDGCVDDDTEDGELVMLVEPESDGSASLIVCA